MEAIRAEGLSFAYPGRDPLLRDISFSLNEGETMVLAGLSGSGKTTLAHILCGLIPHLIKGQLSGRVSLFGQDITGLTTAQLAEKAALVFQDSDEQLICTTVEDELAFGPENLALPPEMIASRVQQGLDDCHLSHLRLRDPARLSGGQKKLTALASVLTLGPRLVIFDEPLSGLDQQGRDIVCQQLAELKAAGRSVLIVEHDLNAADAALADRWLILADGQVAAWDTPERLRAGRLLYDLELLYDD